MRVSWNVKRKDCEGLLECKEEGLIDHIVFSSHQPGTEIKHILEEGKMEGVLLGINILNFPYRWDGVMAAYQKGYGVVAMNPLHESVIWRSDTYSRKRAFIFSLRGRNPYRSSFAYPVHKYR
jgi:hypothetical protein